MTIENEVYRVVSGEGEIGTVGDKRYKTLHGARIAQGRILMAGNPTWARIEVNYNKDAPDDMWQIVADIGKKQSWI